MIITVGSEYSKIPKDGVYLELESMIGDADGYNREKEYFDFDNEVDMYALYLFLNHPHFSSENKYFNNSPFDKDAFTTYSEGKRYWKEFCSVDYPSLTNFIKTGFYKQTGDLLIPDILNSEDMRRQLQWKLNDLSHWSRVCPDITSCKIYYQGKRYDDITIDHDDYSTFTVKNIEEYSAF